MTEAQTASRRANIAKGRQASIETRRRQGLESARRTLALVESGATREEIAEELGLSIHSVRTTVDRARDRVAQEETRPTPAAPEGFQTPSEIRRKDEEERKSLEEFMVAFTGEENPITVFRNRQAARSERRWSKTRR